MDLVIFCDSLSARSLLVSHFTLEIAELSCNPPLYGSSQLPTPIMCLYNHLKWQEIQLAMHLWRGYSSLIDLE